VIPRAETISICARTTPNSSRAGDARPDVRGPRPRRHVSRDRTGDALIELLEELTQQGHEYVLVGGYAVSAFNARFSTDLDIVVAPDSKADFVEFLEQRGFEETDSHAKESLLVSLGVRIIIGFIVLAVASGCVLLPSESTSFTT